MFPTLLELEVLHSERMREAQKRRLLREYGGPTLFERIRAHLSKLGTPAQPEPVSISRPRPCDALPTSR